jgi:hypothetical protein
VCPRELNVHLDLGQLRYPQNHAEPRPAAEATALAGPSDPTSSSRQNQIGRCFAKLTDKQIRCGVHLSVEELEAAHGLFRSP